MFNLITKLSTTIIAITILNSIIAIIDFAVEATTTKYYAVNPINSK
jgi:hypothetical protein